MFKSTTFQVLALMAITIPMMANDFYALYQETPVTKVSSITGVYNTTCSHVNTSDYGVVFLQMARIDRARSKYLDNRRVKVSGQLAVGADMYHVLCPEIHYWHSFETTMLLGNNGEDFFSIDHPWTGRFITLAIISLLLSYSTFSNEVVFGWMVFMLAYQTCIRLA